MSVIQFNLGKADAVLNVIKTRSKAERLAVTDLDDAGAAYHAYGCYPEAESCYKKVIELKDEKGQHDEAYLNTVRRLAILHRIQHEDAAAEKEYLKAIALAKEIYGPNHIKVAEQNNYLAGLYQTNGMSANAIRVIQESQAMYEKLEGAQSPNVGACHFALALVCSKAGKNVDAANQFNQAQIIMASNVAEPDETIANGLFGMAIYHYRKNDLEGAEALFRHSIILREESLWPFHPLVTSTLLKLGTFFEAQGLNDKAELCYINALEKQTKAFGEEHPSLSDSLNKLASFYQRHGTPAKARDIGHRLALLKKS